MGVYESLGLRSVINAQGRYTTLGGSLLPPEVGRAMAEASRSYVDFPALQQRAGELVAELTSNEAAYITNGATGGLFVAILACMTRLSPEAVYAMPDRGGLPDEVVVHRVHRHPLDLSVVLAGARFVEIGNRLVTHRSDLEAALGDRTAAILYTAGDFYRLGSLPLPEVLEVARARDVPVIVDAAEQVPPVQNLWHYTRELGCDLAVFSGGKGICGPQASGIVVGRPDLIVGCREHGFPNTRLGRAMKVGKEEIVGLLTALKLCLGTNRTEQVARWNAIVAGWAAELDGSLPVTAEVCYPSWSSEVARLLVRPVPGAPFGVRDIRRRMLEGHPAVAVEVPPNADQIFVNPEPLEPGEEKLVMAALEQALRALGR
jgi:D-glucosaminate-6-phosphate ammonia-lyase